MNINPTETAKNRIFRTIRKKDNGWVFSAIDLLPSQKRFKVLAAGSAGFYLKLHMQRLTKHNKKCYILCTMQSIQILKNNLETLANPEHYLFSVSDFSALFPQKSMASLMVLLGRAVKSGALARICRGFYLYTKTAYPRDLVLFHLASRLRADYFSYLSLETVLSENGIISQIPLSCITLMTSGRSGIINCGRFGRIEFTHTKKSFDEIMPFLSYDYRYGLWRASTEMALQDLRVTGREKLYEFFL